MYRFIPISFKVFLHKVRIIAVTIAASRPICLINAYLPTQDTGSQVEYSDCLDIIQSIFAKFQGTYDVILCGDLNGTLLDSRTNKHDKLLKELTSELQLSTGIPCENKPTFYHHAGTSTSQIDYILVQDKTLISNYIVYYFGPVSDLFFGTCRSESCSYRNNS